MNTKDIGDILYENPVDESRLKSLFYQIKNPDIARRRLKLYPLGKGIQKKHQNCRIQINELIDDKYINIQEEKFVAVIKYSVKDSIYYTFEELYIVNSNLVDRTLTASNPYIILKDPTNSEILKTTKVHEWDK